MRNLISSENRTDKKAGDKRLAGFIMLNPHEADYAYRLDKLLEKIKDNDPLRDNILLAQIKLIADEQLKLEEFTQLHKKFPDTDGGTQALYELGLLKMRLWQQDQSNPEKKKEYLADARAALSNFLELYPDNFCAEQVRKNLDNLPAVE